MFDICTFAEQDRALGRGGVQPKVVPRLGRPLLSNSRRHQQQQPVDQMPPLPMGVPPSLPPSPQWRALGVVY